MAATNTHELYELIDRAIDEAFAHDRYVFRMYDYLKLGTWTRRDTLEFTESDTATRLSDMCLDLEAYIKGRDKFLKEAYGHIGKPKAKKLNTYFYGMLEDSWKYAAERKPGRKPGTKNRKTSVRKSK